MKDMIAKTMGEKSHKTKIEIKFLVLSAYNNYQYYLLKIENELMIKFKKEV